jgi:hypothetical protein
MMGTVHRLPVRPSPRLVGARPTPSVTLAHFDRELRQIAISLHEATGHFGMLATEAVSETALSEGAVALEAALFHALTLNGCRNDDKLLRDMLHDRASRREGFEHG